MTSPTNLLKAIEVFFTVVLSLVLMEQGVYISNFRSNEVYFCGDPRCVAYVDRGIFMSRSPKIYSVQLHQKLIANG